MENQRRRSPDRPLIPIPAFLDTLRTEQAKEFQSLDLGLRDLENPDSLMAFYRGTSIFNASYESFKKYFTHALTEEQAVDARSQFAGKVFEDLSFLFLGGAELKKARIVLSPARTCDFWQRLYPSGDLVEQPNGDIFARWNIPDGLVVERDALGRIRIVYVCEYSSKNDLTKILSSKGRTLKNDIAVFPQVFKYAERLFVLPEGKTLPETSELKGIGVVNLPTDSKDFGKFIDELVGVHRQSPRSLTMLEVQNSVRQRVRTERVNMEGPLGLELRKIMPHLNLREDIASAD